MDVDASSEPPLLSIPLEVLLHVTSYLTTPEYGNVRRTCKTIEATLLNSFAREFFTKRQFMLTEFSLQALVDISKSRLSRYTNHVIIGLERPSGTHLIQAHQNQNTTQHNNLMLEHVSHNTLLNSGHDVEMLAEAFSNLPNLETIGLRDFNSHSRNRDWPQNQWRSYGFNTYTQETGHMLEEPHRGPVFGHVHTMRNDMHSYLSRVFLTLLRALGKASSTPKHFEVILRHIQLFDQTFNIPKYVETTIQPVLANLRTLFLDLSPYLPTLQVELDGKPTSCDNYFLLPFLSKLTHLEHLRLNFRSYPERYRNDTISWLSKNKEDTIPTPVNNTTGISLQFPQSVDFAHLRQLDIGMILIDPANLLAIVKKYRTTLRAISFHKVTLLEADSVDAEQRVNLWSKLFTRFSKLDLKLDFMSMSILAQTQLGHKHYRTVTFKGTRNPTVKKWAGTDIQSGLRDFISDIVVNRLDQDTETDSVHSEDDSDHSMGSDGSEYDEE